MMRGDDFWNQYRPVPLTQTESSMDMLVKRLEQMPGFKYVIFVLKAFYRELCGNRDQGASQQGRYRSGKHHDLQ